MAAYYKISYGTGFAWLQSYVIKVDNATSDYGLLTDILIDYLVEHDKRNILDMDNEYEWDDNGENVVSRDKFKTIHYPDEFVIGGNCGNVLMHYGSFDIREVSENEIGELTVIDCT